MRMNQYIMWTIKKTLSVISLILTVLAASSADSEERRYLAPDMSAMQVRIAMSSVSGGSSQIGQKAETPSQVHISDIHSDIEHYAGREVTIRASFGDPGRACSGVPHTRSDWCVHDQGGAIYVSGQSPPVKDVYGRSDWGTPLEVRGIVMQTGDHVIYIRAVEVKKLD